MEDVNPTGAAGAGDPDWNEADPLRDASSPRETRTQAFLERVRRIAGDGQVFRFISEPRRSVYLSILHCLLRRRLAHEMEVYHDDLRDDVARILGDVFHQGYDPLQFRSDIEQLGRWGNITERVEPTRIRSLADRGRSKLLLRLEPATVAFLEFLESQADPLPLGVRDQGANLLADVHASLKEAVSALASARKCLAADDGRLRARPGREGALAEALLRASHLVHEADAKADRAAGELLRFGDLLARFLTEPFRVGDLAAIASWLERYVDRYLTVLDERSRAVRKALSRLRSPRLEPLLEEADRIERARILEAPGILAHAVRLRRIGDVLASLRVFFDPATGLAAQCRRLNRRTRDAIRRIQRHVEAVRLRNVRTEMIRARLEELFALEPGAGGEGHRTAVRFIEELVAPAGASTDARGGTPDARATPPRPARRYESLRPAFRGESLEPKRSTPAESRELERLRLEKLSRFIEARVLRGRPAAPASGARLEEVADGALLIRAVSAYLLRGGRARDHLTYVLDRFSRRARAAIEAPDHCLDLPETIFRRKA